MASTNTTSVSLKLLIDTKGRKVLFAEATKEVVDFLFTLLSLPVGTVVRLLSKNGMVGCLGQLYESVENLNDTNWQPNVNEDILLKPKLTIAGANILHLLTDDSNNKISTSVTYVAPQAPTTNTATASASEGGYVKGVVTYMIMDNLEVKPMSLISSIDLLKLFNIKEASALEEKVVNLGNQEGLKLLKASLESNTVLTNVFLEYDEYVMERHSSSRIPNERLLSEVLGIPEENVLCEEEFNKLLVEEEEKFNTLLKRKERRSASTRRK